MMTRRARLRSMFAIALLVGGALSHPSVAQEQSELPPYAMLRSLQFVQDSVVLGDHSAGEMQRFMLGRIEQRLRTADMSVFEDPRNVDAALIYAMSGGNPATLEHIVARDVPGYFDNRVADALRKYLNGKGTLVAKSLGEMAREYRDQKIGPYLALVSGNVTVPKDPEGALEFYDWARLTAPGTIVEEAALRRSVAIAVDADLVAKGLDYSRRYARRFVHSPYASQFADFFVQLVVEHFGEIDERDIDGTLEFMDIDRRREVYLRIARVAAVAGNRELARLASARAAALSGDAAMPDPLARLYSGIADIPTAAISTVVRNLAEIPQEELSDPDKALRKAAEAVAEEVLRPPAPATPAQDISSTMPITGDAAVAAPPGDGTQKPTLSEELPSSGPPVDLDPGFQAFVENGRSRLQAVDDLLNEEGASR